MKRMSKRIPKLCLHKASGRAVVKINGRDHYLGKYGSKEARKEYDRLIKEWTATGCSISFGFSANTVSVAMLVADYRDYANKYYPKGCNSEAVTVRLATNYLADYYSLPANQFSPLKLKAVREKILASKHARTGKPQTRVYTNKLISVICRMFRWAAENELVSITTSQALSNVTSLKRGRCEAPETEKVLPVADAIVDVTLPHCGPVVGDMIRVQRLTGMRPAEVCSITPGVIDRSGVVWVATLVDHKTAWRDQDREVFIGPKAQLIIRKYLDRLSDKPIFSPAEAEEIRRQKANEQRVTPEGQGNSRGSNKKANPKRAARDRYDTSSYRRAIHRACDKAFPAPTDCTDAEVEQWQSEHRWSPNQLRHATATEVRKKHGIEGAQVTLGHSSANVTQVYAERDRQLGIAIALEIG